MSTGSENGSVCERDALGSWTGQHACQACFLINGEEALQGWQLG